MKHYDRSPGVAVGEWRNALIQARSDQYLPLLYVANEVLQTSKRNRGNKFLEAFSPVLGQSLIFVCGKSDAPTVDRIRRTVKIWAERRVFSVRYVNELIKGLEPYRSGKRQQQQSSSSSHHERSNEGSDSPGGSRFSPVTEPKSSDMDSEKDEDGDTSMFEDNSNTQQDDSSNSGSDDDDDGDDLFGTASKKLLKIDVDFGSATSVMDSRGGSSAKKRLRSLDIGSDITATKFSKAKRRASAQYLSASSLLELMNQVASQQENYERLTTKLKGLREMYGNSSDVKRIEMLVGQDLLEEYKKTLKSEQEIDKHKRELHVIAQKRRALEIEALRYLPWLERALKQDKEDVVFSQKFRKQLELFKSVHGPTKEARDRRLKEEALRLQKEEERLQKKEEEEERKKFADSAMAKQMEAKPGMVWNRAMGEYQYPNQEESWRD